MSLKYYLLILSFFLCGISFAQTFDTSKENLKLNIPVSDNRMAARDLHQVLSAGLSSEFNIHPQSLFEINTYIIVGDSKMIEGMETYTYIDVDLEFQLKNAATKELRKWSYEGKGKGSNINDAVSNAIKKFQTTDKGLKAMSSEIASYMDNEFVNHCDEFIKQADTALGKDDLRTALLIINNLKQDSPCEMAKKDLEQKIAANQAQAICDQRLQRIKILVNSKKQDKLDHAVRELLMIPPNAPCAAEALAISKEIGELINQKADDTQELLIKFQHIFNDRSMDEWFTYFLSANLNN